MGEMSEDLRYTLDDVLMPKREPSKRNSPLATAAMVALVAGPILLVAATPTIMSYIRTNYPAAHQTIMSYLETK